MLYIIIHKHLKQHSLNYWLKSSVISLLLFVSTLTSLAQQNQYKFVRLDNNQGLSNNQVTAIFKDSKGFMWFGTMSGLNRYDGYNFKVFRHSLSDTSTINDNFINRIVEDDENNLWIGTRSGFSIYNPKKESFSRNLNPFLKKFGITSALFTNIMRDRSGNVWIISSSSGIYKRDKISGKITRLFHTPSDSTSLYSNDISAIAEDNNGDYWVISRRGILEKIDGKTLKVIYRNFLINREFSTELMNFGVFIDADNDLWVFVPSDAKGLYYFNNAKKTFAHITKDTPKIGLNTNIVSNIVQDGNGILWIGTDHGGVNLLDKKDFSVRYLTNNPDEQRSLSQNSIVSMYRDDVGIIWIGTYKKGINYYHENLIKFQLIKHKPNIPNSLGFDDENCFAEDEKGNLWIGTNGGGLIYYDRKLNHFTSYNHQPENLNSLSNDIIVSLYIDKQQKLWIGTYFGGLCVYDGKKFRTFRHNPSNQQSIADDRIWRVYEDSKNNLWIGTLGGGLELFDRQKEIFYHYRNTDANSVRSPYVVCFEEDEQNNLWIGTADGIDIMQRSSGRFSHLAYDPSNPQSLSNNNVTAILCDSRKMIWVSTREGLNLYNKGKGTFSVFREENGLPDNSVLSLLEDNNHNLWLSTPNGLSNVIVSKKKNGEYNFDFKNYDESDGLQGKSFNENAALRTKSGELVFGGVNGFNICQPSDIRINKAIPQVFLTDFFIFNKSVKVNDRAYGRVVLNEAISETKDITLKYDENIFAIEFAALNYIHPEKNRYMYMLEGFNNRWMKADGQNRKATYTNLNPGRYTFKVKASNNDDVWNTNGASLVITVLPPFWKTKTAIVIYFIIIILALLLSRTILLERTKLTFKLEQERRESQQNHELDMMKIRFFTNISHEFRTPLTLIITPLEKIIKNTKDQDQKQHLDLIYRNAKRLLNLVNQLLDFRRMEVQELKLNPSHGDIVAFIKDIAYSFSDISEKKNILFSFHTEIGELNTFFDQDKLEKILFNLLSNAYKFTPEQGSVSVFIRLINQTEEQITLNQPKTLEIKVSDTGIGIEPDKQEKIFERFFQNELPTNIINQGSGIGLAITREFVKLHGGSISVFSEPSKGSCFTVLLPLSNITEDIVKDSSSDKIQENYGNEKHSNKPLQNSIPNKPNILLIEDNEDFRFYLKDNFRDSYHMLDVSNGMEGWRQILTHMPDLVICDVMIPELSGIELCQKIKNDPRTSHIPVILLTARHAEEQKLEGLQSGADDYITKPFNFEFLEIRIRNLISQRDSLRKLFQKQLVINPSEISVTSLDEKLIQKAIELVEKNMDNPNFSVEELSRELAMSRVHLYKKLLSLTGKSPIEFIRILRLKRAAQLLEKSQLSVSEIAYQVGFNNPKYFTKYFKVEFGVLPSQYQQQKS